MIAALKTYRTGFDKASWHLLIIPAYLILTCLGLKGYFLTDSINCQAGLIALIICSDIHKHDKGNIRFAVAAILLALLCWLIPVKTVMYAALASGFLFFIESFYGRMNGLFLLVLVFISPIFEYAANVFSFPIRLALTDTVGHILAIAGVKSQVEGNILLLNGKEFSVDPACMGLHMLVISFLAGTMLIAVYQKKYRCRINGWRITGLLLFIVGCNIISNLFRILFLVYFSVMPSSLMHEVAGSVCFLLYIVVPALCLTRYIVKRQGITEKGNTDQKLLLNYKGLLILNGIILSIIAAVVSFNTYHVPAPQQAGSFSGPANYKKEVLEDNVMKLQNGRALIYIKPIRGFYSSDHHPMICWKGSGYIFRKIKEERMNGYNAYTAELQNKSDRLYTAWWYENGLRSTNSQLSWRWDAFSKGKQYALVNITASTRAELEIEVERFGEENVFNQIIK